MADQAQGDMHHQASGQQTVHTLDGVDAKSALLRRGYHALAFGAGDARLHFENHTHCSSFDDVPISYDGSTSCFFVQRDALGRSHSPIFLDLNPNPAAPSIISQEYWQLNTEADLGRFVKGDNVKLEDTIFLLHEGVEGALGLTVEQAVQGKGTHLKGWKETANLGDKASAHIRLWFPGRQSWKRQIQTKDHTSSRNPILLKGFVQHIGRCVEAYFQKNAALCSISGEPITSKELIILGAVHVSAGSWQPILAYNMRETVE